MSKKRVSCLARFFDNPDTQPAIKEERKSLTSARQSDITATLKRIHRLSISSTDNNLTFIVEKIRPRASIARHSPADVTFDDNQSQRWDYSPNTIKPFINEPPLSSELQQQAL
jgi:hypothetical protein